jgi:simple sugar transport system permease protein
LRANPIVSSIALNLLAAGMTGLLLHEVFQAYGTSPTVAKLPVLQKAFFEAVPIVGGLLAGLLGELSVVVPSAFVLAAGLMIWFCRSAGGLRLQACGENPEAADAAGLSVFRIRYTAVLCSGLLAGVGGAYLSIGELSQFVENMTQGRGYLAIAALILARWRPVGVLWAALLFGFSEALSEWLAVLRPQFPSQAFLAFPYLICLAVLATQMSRKRPPSALGQLK